MYTSGDVIGGKHNLDASAVMSSWPGAKSFSPWIMFVISSKGFGARNIEAIELLPKKESEVLDCSGILLAEVGPTPMKKCIFFFTNYGFYLQQFSHHLNLNLDCISKSLSYWWYLSK